MRVKKIIPALLLAVTVCCTGCNGGESSRVVGTIESYEGYTRVVGQEEYDFYSYFVERDASNDISEEELTEKIQAYINEVNAVFYLGNKLGLYEPYSFELLQLRMEQENADRKLKLEQGEAIYGLQQYTLETYFQYEFSNLKLDIEDYLYTNMDDEMLKEAKKYYENNKESFKAKESVTYELTQDGTTETVISDSTQLNFLGKSDMGLADFLNAAEVGDTYEDEQDGTTREVKVTDIQYTEEGFEANKDSVIHSYISGELLPSLIEQVAENNPVEFELD